MFFDIILIVLILVIFRKQKPEYAEEPKIEIIFCFSWFLLYFTLAMISSAIDIDIINEVTNWLFLVLFPLLIIARLRKEKVRKNLNEIGLKCMDKKTAIRTLLVCILYIGIVICIFGLGEEAANIWTNLPKIMAKYPLFLGLMISTAAFTEEFFFRGILQRYLMNSLKRPYIAILLAGILFGLYHFPFAFYLWDETAGSVVNSLKAVMAEQAVAGCALGLIYYKSDQNLWSCIILHACANAVIASLGVVLLGS